MSKIKERESELTQGRVDYAQSQLLKIGIESEYVPESRAINFIFKGNRITIWPYTGWFAGKGVKSGRGIENLIKQLK